MRRGAAFAIGGAAIMAASLASPAPGVSPPKDPPRDAAQCASCHASQAASWRTSAHARAWSNDVFQAAYRIEPQAFCRGCHAPLSDPAREPTPTGAADGVACISCHAKPHVEAIDRERVCARCHEFAFPSRSAHGPTLMQRTLQEHRASASTKSCIDCHMSEGHSMLVDAGFIRTGLSVDVRARRTHDVVVVRFALTSRAGHAVPTGDMMRRLELRAWVDGKPPVRTELAREFADLRENGRNVRVEIGDSRVPADGHTLVRELELFAPGAHRIQFSVDRLRMPEPQARSQNIRDEVNRATLVTSSTAIE